VKMI